MSYGLGFLTPGATDEGQVLDPASVLKRRRVVEAMMEKGTDTSPLQSPWQGAARLVQGALAGYEGGRLDKQESDERRRIGGLGLFDGDASPAISNVTAAMTSPAPGSPSGGVSDYARAIQSNESGGRYDALGPVTKTGDRAYGAYQVMGNNVGPWTQEVLGRRLTPDQFVADKGAQDAVFNAKFGQSVAKYGNPQDAASVWFTGRPLAQGAGAKDVLGTTGRGYVDKFTAALGGGGQKVASALSDIPAEGAVPAQFQIPGEAPSQTAGQAGVTDALTGGGRRVNLRNAAEIAASPYASPQIRAVAQALLTQAAKPQEFGFTTLPDGTVLRQDPRAGTVSPIYRSEPKPDVDVREVGGRLVATDKRSLSSQDVTPPGASGGKLERDLEQRKAAAAQMGLKPGDPGYQSYALTGRMPREDAQPLSAGDKRAIMTAEDALPEIDSTIDTLSRAKELNSQTYTGFGAGILGKTGTTFPGAGLLLDQKTAGATREFNQLMSMEAIKSMSATLKGATTDREMGRFMDILGDPTTPPEIRANTIDRMLTLAQRQKEISTGRLNELRNGTYYRQGGGQSAAGTETPAPRAMTVPSSTLSPPRPSGSGAAPSREALEAEARRRGLIQ